MQIAQRDHQRSVDDWKRIAPPKRPDQWVEGRSAYELAFAWCASGQPCMPPELSALFDGRDETRGLTVASATPECRIPFDEHGGEPRNADLAFVGSGPLGRIAVTIEAKADESFGETVVDALGAALDRLDTNPRSKGIQRIEGLVKSLFMPRQEGMPKVGDLRTNF